LESWFRTYRRDSEPFPQQRDERQESRTSRPKPSFERGSIHHVHPRRVPVCWKVIPATLIACGADEEDTSKPVLDAVPGKQKVLYRAIDGRHGSSILIDDPANWSAITPILSRFVRNGKHDAALPQKTGADSPRSGRPRVMH